MVGGEWKFFMVGGGCLEEIFGWIGLSGHFL